MEINRVTAEEYQQWFPAPSIVFNSASFSELNKEKCTNLHYLIFRNSKLRLGIILGEMESILACPFSAPFGSFIFNRRETIEYYDESVALLKEYVKSLDKHLRVTLPPAIYGTEMAKMFSSLLRAGASVVYSDLNYHYDLSRFAHFEDYLARSARKNFNAAHTHAFEFVKLDSNNPSDVARAYHVIKENRAQRGFPLKMTLENVLNTIQIIPADFFVMSYEGVDIAAAQVFRVSDAIAQVIYWGDLPEYSHLRTMNMFPYKIFEYYHNNTEIRILDIGPSTDAGIPNYGLCDFKECIGCDVSLKHTLIL